MSETQWTPGRMVLRELMTSDAARARSFYGELFGWTSTEPKQGSDQNYATFRQGEKVLAGFWQLGPTQIEDSRWMSYVSVRDVDATAKAAAANGGRVVHGPADFPGLGRFAVLEDAEGLLILALRHVGGDPAPAMPKAGEFCWETLSTSDPEKTKDFYLNVFGWQVLEGGAGGIPVFSADGTPQTIVADLQQARNFRPQWLTYVAVENLEATRDKAVGLGAKVRVPLVDIPSVGRIAMIEDPTGAVLGLYEPARRN
jgi:hypothetical protein